MRYIIWDWNGTLLDDVHVSYEILNLLLKKHGNKTVESVEAYREVFGFPIKDYYSRAGFDLTKTEFETLAHEYILEYAERAKGCKLNANALKVLRAISDMGIAQIVLSASKQSELNDQVNGYDIAHLFKELVGTKDIYAASKLSAAQDWLSINKFDSAVMIGDTLHDFEVASAIGAKPLLYSGGHHTVKALQVSGATVINGLYEVLEYIAT